MFKTKSTVTLTVCGMLIALDVVLTRFASINLWDRRIGFSFLAIALAAYWFGPIGAALTHGIADFVGAILFPTGAYFPGFTLTAMIIGAIYGMFMHRETRFWKIGMGVVISQIVGSLLLNSLWITLTATSGNVAYLPVLISRLPQAGLMTTVQLIVLPLILSQLKRFPLLREK